MLGWFWKALLSEDLSKISFSGILMLHIGLSWKEAYKPIYTCVNWSHYGEDNEREDIVL